MRRSTLASQFAVPILLACVLQLPTALLAAEVHPIETQLRRSFPSLSLKSSATFDPADAVVNGRSVSGIRARFPRIPDRRLPGENRAEPQSASAIVGSVETAEQTLKVQYPRSYDDPIVVEMGSQRVVLRPIGAKAAFVSETGGKLLYERPYQSTDVIEIPGEARSEEFLLIHDSAAPRVYDYEIVESQGIGRVILDGGAVRFLPKAGPIPALTDIATGRFSQPTPSLQIDRPWIVDASGHRSESHAQWTLLGDGAFPKIIRLTLNGDHLSYPLVVDPSFSATGNLARARSTHTATLLPNGKVLIAGGLNGVSNSLASAELYDPVSGRSTSWSFPRASNASPTTPPTSARKWSISTKAATSGTAGRRVKVSPHSLNSMNG